MNAVTQGGKRTLLALASLLATQLAVASPLTECQDTRLAGMDAAELAEALQTSGAQNCKVQETSWGNSVSCAGARDGTEAWGLPVRELSAEVHEDGQRTVLIVTSATLQRTTAVVDKASAVPGLRLSVDPQDNGVNVISCVADNVEQSVDLTQ